jgi:chondroitin-sulfate-ABC endolyase/exolyase
MSELFFVFVVFAFVLAACTRAWGEQGTYYESFEDGVPETFIPTRSESLGLCPWHYKQGSNSLRWEWRRGEDLVIHHGIGDVARTGGFGARAGFSVWLYVEAPVPDALIFEFREGETVTGFFRFPLDFTGWKQARPHYSEFPHGKPTAEVDNIRIAAPNEVAEGTVFLDFLKYNTLTHGNNSVDPEKVAQWRSPVPDEGRFPRPERVTEEELSGIRNLLGPDEGEGIEQARVEELCERVAALGIVRDEHGVRGPGIDAYYQFYPSAEEQAALGSGYWSDEHGPDWMGMQDPKTMSAIAYEVAGAYRASKDGDQRSRLAEAFFLIADHLHDQALQAGSGFKWNWWVGGTWAEALFLMRDLLAETGRLQRHLDFQLYTYGGGVIFEDGDVLSHMDFYHLTVPCLFRACLMQVETAEQVRWLNALKAMLEISILQPTSALKIDGSAYHHSGHYHSYAQNAFGTLPPLFLSLNDTPWQLSPEVRERLRRAVLAQRIYCNRLDVPLSLCGRSPFRPGYGVIHPRTLEGLERLARCGTPDGTQDVDREVAAAYLRLAPGAAEEEPYRSLGIAPEAEPNGTFLMPYAALLCHRREDWLATVHGQSKYNWGTERQDHHNRFGLFQGLGHLEIMAGGTPVTASDSGREGKGWDWCRYEGTTVPQVRLEMLEEGGRGVGRSYSSETVVGGLSHKGRQGVFAMVVNQPMPGEKTLTGRKSWFFNDDQIVCLGSDIFCDESNYPTQTTLCQKALRTNQDGGFPATLVDGEDIAEFPAEQTLDEANSHWLIDVQQTGYYLPAGQRAMVARAHQESRDSWDEGDTEGDFLTAWLDHGLAPKSESYEYLLVVRATPERMAEYAAEPPYQVIQCDHDAHIVRQADTGRWSCVFFVEQEVTQRTADGEALPIRAVERPCLIVADPIRDGKLELSVVDPDLNLKEEVNEPQHLRFTVGGAWRLQNAKGTVCAWELPDVDEDVSIESVGEAGTVVEIICRHGASYDLTLELLTE